VIGVYGHVLAENSGQMRPRLGCFGAGDFFVACAEITSSVDGL
jgi:hypothetical protein